MAKANAIPGGAAMPLDRAKDKSRSVDPASTRLGTFQGGAPDTVRDAGFYARKRAAEAAAGRPLTIDEFRANCPATEDEATASGTSIFDPVLCEIAYRWFSPPGGTVLGPFAGGSVRGIVAAKLGRQYIGGELRPEQVEANRAQADELCANDEDPPALCRPGGLFGRSGAPFHAGLCGLPRGLFRDHRQGLRTAEERPLRLLRGGRGAGQARGLLRFRWRYRPGLPRGRAGVLQRGD